MVSPPQSTPPRSTGTRLVSPPAADAAAPADPATDRSRRRCRRHGADRPVPNGLAGVPTDVVPGGLAARADVAALASTRSRTVSPPAPTPPRRPTRSRRVSPPSDGSSPGGLAAHGRDRRARRPRLVRAPVVDHRPVIVATVAARAAAEAARQALAPVVAPAPGLRRALLTLAREAPETAGALHRRPAARSRRDPRRAALLRPHGARLRDLRGHDRARRDRGAAAHQAPLAQGSRVPHRGRAARARAAPRGRAQAPRPVQAERAHHRSAQARPGRAGRDPGVHHQPRRGGQGRRAARACTRLLRAALRGLAGVDQGPRLHGRAGDPGARPARLVRHRS